MQVLYTIWDVFFNQIIVKPQLLLAIIVAIGYMFLKRPWTTVVSGAIKTTVGIMILQLGSGQLINTFRPIMLALSERFGIQGTIIDGYVGFPMALEALGDRQSWVGYVILIALAVNIFLVAIGAFRSVFLTGHIMFQQSAIATWIVVYTLGLPLLPSILIAGALVGLYWTIGFSCIDQTYRCCYKQRWIYNWPSTNADGLDYI